MVEEVELDQSPRETTNVSSARNKGIMWKIVQIVEEKKMRKLLISVMQQL